MHLRVTGFGSFGSIADNPSAALAAACGAPFRILEVAFAAVDEFLAELASEPPGRLLLMGVAGQEADPRHRIEMVGRNRIGQTPDVRNIIAGPGPIEPFGPPQRAATLWRNPEFFSEGRLWRPSVDAGDYLCNYSLYRALETLPAWEVGFLHVPPVATWPLDAQAEALARILDHLTTE